MPAKCAMWAEDVLKLEIAAKAPSFVSFASALLVPLAGEGCGDFGARRGGKGQGRTSGEGAGWRGSVGRVAARGKPWPDRRCSNVSRVAPSGTRWADRPASIVSRVAPPWHSQAALTCLFVGTCGDLSGTCRELVCLFVGPRGYL